MKRKIFMIRRPETLHFGGVTFLDFVILIFFSHLSHWFGSRNDGDTETARRLGSDGYLEFLKRKILPSSRRGMKIGLLTDIKVSNL
jgi:hypothetical protein